MVELVSTSCCYFLPICLPSLPSSSFLLSFLSPILLFPCSISPFPPTPPQSLLPRNPQLIFAHFHFLLDDPDLLTCFMHIVHAQPFDDRKKWFYENLYQGKPPNNELTLAAETNAIMVDRGKWYWSSRVSLCECVCHVCVHVFPPSEPFPNPHPIHTHTDNIFTTSCEKISTAPVAILKDQLTIQFLGEAGMVSTPYIVMSMKATVTSILLSFP